MEDRRQPAPYLESARSVIRVEHRPDFCNRIGGRGGSGSAQLEMSEFDLTTLSRVQIGMVKAAVPDPGGWGSHHVGENSCGIHRLPVGSAGQSGDRSASSAFSPQHFVHCHHKGR